MNVLMVGVGPKRVGGMWTVAEQYITSEDFNEKVNLTYVSTSTNGSMLIRFLYMILGYIKILWILSTKPIEIVHIHMAEKGSVFRKGRVARWGKLKNKKVIIHLHAGPFMAWYKKTSPNTQRRICKIMGYSDLVFVLGEYWKRELSEIIPEEKMIVLYNGVECPKINQYNIQAKNIVYFGVMKKEKGTYDLIEAIHQINDKLPEETKVVLCGNDLEGDIRQVIANAGLSKRFELPGWVVGNEKEHIFSDAMIDVLPSYYEGLSMTVLEAMARGIPIITTDISTMPELLEKDRLIKPGDSKALANEILKLIESAELRMNISNSQYHDACEKFSVANFISRTIVSYDACLKSKKEEYLL